jgi:hypothetical protein
MPRLPQRRGEIIDLADSRIPIGLLPFAVRSDAIAHALRVVTHPERPQHVQHRGGGWLGLAGLPVGVNGHSDKFVTPLGREVQSRYGSQT